MKNFIAAAKRFFRKNTAPFLAGGALFVFIYIVVFGEAPSPNPEAPDQVARFRKWYAFRRGHGLWYDTLDYKKFIDTFSNLVKYADNPDMDHSDKTKYHWVIGFYWMRKEDPRDEKVKYSYSIVPTLLEIKDGDTTVIDYFEDAEKAPNEQHYNHKFDKNRARAKLTDPYNNAFDNGQLWP